MPTWWQKDPFATVWLSLSRRWMVAGLPHCCRIGQPVAGAVVPHGIIGQRRGHAKIGHLAVQQPTKFVLVIKLGVLPPAPKAATRTTFLERARQLSNVPDGGQNWAVAVASEPSASALNGGTNQQIRRDVRFHHEKVCRMPRFRQSLCARSATDL